MPVSSTWFRMEPKDWCSETSSKLRDAPKRVVNYVRSEMSSKLRWCCLGVGVYTPEEGVDSPVFGAFVHLGCGVDINGLCARTNKWVEIVRLMTTTQSTPRQSARLRRTTSEVELPDRMPNARNGEVYLCWRVAPWNQTACLLLRGRSLRYRPLKPEAKW